MQPTRELSSQGVACYRFCAINNGVRGECITFTWFAHAALDITIILPAIHGRALCTPQSGTGPMLSTLKWCFMHEACLVVSAPEHFKAQGSLPPFIEPGFDVAFRAPLLSTPTPATLATAPGPQPTSWRSAAVSHPLTFSVLQLAAPLRDFRHLRDGATCWSSMLWSLVPQAAQ